MYKEPEIPQSFSLCFIKNITYKLNDSSPYKLAKVLPGGDSPPPSFTQLERLKCISFSEGDAMSSFPVKSVPKILTFNLAAAKFSEDDVENGSYLLEAIKIFKFRTPPPSWSFSS